MRNAISALIGLLLLALAATPVPVIAQDASSAPPIRLVIGFAPGGAADTVGRLLAQKLPAQINAKVFIENKDGANSNIAADYVAKSKADGNTLLFNTPSNILSAAFGEKLSYDVLEDLTPIALVGLGPQVLSVHPAVAANNVPEFIAHLRANPGKLAYGSGGIGAITHLAPLLFLQANNLNALHVPYKGAAPAVLDLVAGRVQFTMSGLGAVLPFAKEKRIKILAIGSRKRTPQLPDVPTLGESMPGFEVGTWYGVMGPAKTPSAVAQRVNAAVVRALSDPDLKIRLAQNDVEPVGSSPDEYGAYLKSELERWTRVIKSANLKLE